MFYSNVYSGNGSNIREKSSFLAIIHSVVVDYTINLYTDIYHSQRRFFLTQLYFLVVSGISFVYITWEYIAYFQKSVNK